MRGALLLIVFGGCIQRDPQPTGDDTQVPPPPPPPPPTGCDNSCPGGEVCARDGECLPPSQVWAVHLTWTVQGAPADATTCASHPDLFVDFIDDSQDRFGFAPVPCVEGRFNVDKLPVRFDMTELGVEDSHMGTTMEIDATGAAVFDLP
jgi:hypothetical protein